MHKNAYFNKATDKFIFVLATLYMENFRNYFSNPFTVKNNDKILHYMQFGHNTRTSTCICKENKCHKIKNLTWLKAH